MKDKIIELIKNSNLPSLQKNVSVGLIERLREIERLRKEDRQFIEQVVGSNLRISEVVLSANDVKIYTVLPKGEWEEKYPYRFIYLTNEGKWRSCSTVSPNLDVAYIVYLEYKYLGLNSQFTKFATKMLEIKVD